MPRASERIATEAKRGLRRIARREYRRSGNKLVILFIRQRRAGVSRRSKYNPISMPFLTRREAAHVLLSAFGFLSIAAKKRPKKRLSLPAAIDQEIARPGPLASAFAGAFVVRLADGPGQSK